MSDTIVEKVRKLRGQAESAAKIGSEAEAQAFAAAVQRMMIQHKISELDLAAAGGEKKVEPIVEVRSSGRVSNDPSRPEPRIYPNRIEWVEALGEVVARAHYCRMMVSSGCKFRSIESIPARVIFVGRKSDAEAALITFEAMVVAAAALGRKEYFIAYDAYRKGEASWERGFYRSYLLGFASRLRERYDEELKVVDKELRLEAGETKQLEGGIAGPCSALVRIAKDSFDAIDEHMDLKRSKGEIGTARHVGVGVSNVGAFKKGRDAADKIKLRPDAQIAGRKTRKLA